MNDGRRILVTGATGQQGGATTRHLLERGFAVRALTRKPDGDRARALAKLGAEVVKGDFDDPVSLEGALTGATGVFAVQTFDKGPDVEVEQGERFAKLARAAGVEHFVYSSVGSAHRNTGIPHFESKWRVEQAVRALGFRNVTVLRPVYFMENVLSPWTLQGDKLISWTVPDTKLQMIAVDDIGRFAAYAFTQPESLRGAAIDLAGDAVTMKKAAAILGEALGRTILVAQQPIEEVRKKSEDLAVMAEWFERVGYDADIPHLRASYGVPLMTFAEWARTKRP
jgi:uncharacterized protein YbjT (DUF2867 family)